MSPISPLPKEMTVVTVSVTIREVWLDRCCQ
jgi:hypothetical protein